MKFASKLLLFLRVREPDYPMSSYYLDCRISGKAWKALAVFFICDAMLCIFLCQGVRHDCLSLRASVQKPTVSIFLTQAFLSIPVAEEI